MKMQKETKIWKQIKKFFINRLAHNKSSRKAKDPVSQMKEDRGSVEDICCECEDLSEFILNRN